MTESPDTQQTPAPDATEGLALSISVWAQPRGRNTVMVVAGPDVFPIAEISTNAALELVDRIGFQQLVADMFLASFEAGHFTLKTPAEKPSNE